MNRTGVHPGDRWLVVNTYTGRIAETAHAESTARHGAQVMNEHEVRNGRTAIYIVTERGAPEADCARTLALYKRGEVMPGVKCSFHWTGRMPCTGRLICHLCGRAKPE